MFVCDTGTHKHWIICVLQVCCSTSLEVDWCLVNCSECLILSTGMSQLKLINVGSFQFWVISPNELYGWRGVETLILAAAGPRTAYASYVVNMIIFRPTENSMLRLKQGHFWTLCEQEHQENEFYWGFSGRVGCRPSLHLGVRDIIPTPLMRAPPWPPPHRAHP